MRVVIENIVSLNVGDAAILQAMMHILRAEFGEDTEFVVFDRDPEAAAKYFPKVDFRRHVSELLTIPRLSTRVFGKSWAVRLRRNAERVMRAEFRRIANAIARGGAPKSPLFGKALTDNIEAYREADLVVSSGGTYLVEHYPLEQKLAELEKDLTLGKPLVFFTQSLGPFRDPNNRARLRKIFGAAKLVLVREPRSRDHIIDLGLSGDNVHVVADSVFALADPKALAAAALPGRNAGRKRVAISVRDWPHFVERSTAEGMAAYEEAIGAAASWLVESQDADVVFLSTCQGIAEYPYDDSATAKRIVDRLPKAIQDRVEIDTAFHAPDELLAMLAGFDFVISTRMHMGILALCAGVPVLPIAYEFKITELFESFGQGQWVSEIESIDPPSFLALVERFSAGLDSYRGAVFPEIIRLSASASSAGPLTRAALAAEFGSAPKVSS